MVKRKQVVVSTNKRLRLRNSKKKPAAELTRLGSALRSLGGLGGRAIGTLAGFGDAGASTGTSIGAAMSRWLGSGDYTVGANSLVAAGGSSSIPMMHSTNQSVIVRHREYVSDIIGGTGTPSTFNQFQSYPLNPGMAVTFPWLSTIAQNFQEYTFKGLIFHYIPTSGNSVASTNTALGAVMMATNYRSQSVDYFSKIILLNEYFSSSAKPSESFVHPIECDPKENPYNVQYIRTTTVPSGEDIKTYDLGKATVATQGLPGASTNIGELWVTYEVELRKPIPIGLLGTDAPYYSELRTGVTASTANFGTTAGTAGGLAIGDLCTVTQDTVTFKRGLIGRFNVEIAYAAASITTISNIVATGTNCTLVDVTQLAASTLTAASGYITQSFTVSITDSNLVASFTSTNAVFVGTCANVYVTAVQIPTSLDS